MNRILIGIAFILSVSCSAGAAVAAYLHWNPTGEWPEGNFVETVFLYAVAVMFAIVSLFIGYALLQKLSTEPAEETS